MRFPKYDQSGRAARRGLSLHFPPLPAQPHGTIRRVSLTTPKAGGPICDRDVAGNPTQEVWQVAFIRHLYRLEADQPIYDSLVAMLTDLGADKAMAHAIADKAIKQVRHQ